MERPHQEHAQEQRPQQEIQEQRLNVPRQEQQQRPHQEQRLYLIFDDYEISLPPLSPYQTRLSPYRTRSSRIAVGCLPQPIICVEARRKLPLSFAAVGTRIVLLQDSSGKIPIIDVCRRGVNFGPAVFVSTFPICLPVGAELFVLDACNVSKLSFKPHCPPQLEKLISSVGSWSWHELPCLPFDRVDVTSYAVHSDGQTILVSTDIYPDKSDAAAATFSFDTRARAPVWKKHGDWTLPFDGRAYFVHSLNAYVGLSKEPATLGHLASCKAATSLAEWKFSKEKLFSEDPAEAHVSATLIYMGRGGGSEFCLVQCVSVKHGNADKNLQKPRCCYRYRLATFSLSYDNNGDLTTGNTSQVQCYEVPGGTTEKFISRGGPVAFWL